LIAAADGFAGPEVYSKPFAKAMVVTGVHHGKINADDVPELQTIIQSSTLPDSDSQAGLPLMAAATRWTMIRSRDVEADPGIDVDTFIHQRMDMFKNL
jgi:hypothetical protein